MRQFLLAAILMLFAPKICSQVTNYAVKFDREGTVDCGRLPDFDCRSSYLIQFWMNPSEWTEGATILSRGEGVRISMGKPGVLHFSIGGTQSETDGIPLNEWSLVTYRNNEGKVFINNKRKGVEGRPIPQDPNAKLVLGGGYVGLVDEVRIWGTALNSDFNYFEHTTLNKWNPHLDDLLVYYKMDQELCPNLVNYKDIYSGKDSYNNHGIFSETGVTRVESGNPHLPYLVNSAYTANERFYDRAIPRDQYLMSNDLIILGIESLPDGHLRTCTPNNHATVYGAEWLPAFEGREGVMAFDGNATLDCGTDIMRPDAPGFTFESWIYVDEWVPGAYIFQKETEDHSQGFSIRLGDEENHEIVVRINGYNFYNQRLMKSGQWVHLAIGINGGNTPSQILWWLYDGIKIGYGSSKCDSSTDYKPVGNSGCHGIIGEGFKGKIDEFAIWDKAVERSNIPNHKDGLPMPALNRSVTSDLLQRANTYLKFDNPDNPGYSSHSQDEWKRIMEGAYEGHRGFRTRISVKSHQGWESTIVSSTKRKIFAEDLARLSEPYDGVELDLEWIYGEQTYLGYLAEDIREVLPADKSLVISCHNVAYRFPKSKMDKCDGFTFQQYGPQNEHSRFSHFKKMTDIFVDYGFPKEKILCSYATTTSEGYSKDGKRVMPIKGVKDGFMEEGFIPDGEIDSGESSGYTYYFDGPLQTYLRAKYVTDNRLGGIFYWDMGNDCRPEHPYNLAKWCSYGLNANVDSLITEVKVNHFNPSGIESPVLDRNDEVIIRYDAPEGMLTIKSSNGSLVSRIYLYSTDGRLVTEGHPSDNTMSGLSLRDGIYIAKVVFNDSTSTSQRIVVGH